MKQKQIKKEKEHNKITKTLFQLNLKQKQNSNTNIIVYQDTKITLLQIHHSGICLQLTWIYDFVLNKKQV